MRVDSGEHKLCEEEKMCIKCVSFMYRNIYMFCVCGNMYDNTHTKRHLCCLYTPKYVCDVFLLYVLYTHIKRRFYCT